jgi:DnaK suppressor protein
MILNKYDSPLLLMAIMLVNNVQISERSWKMDKETQAYFKEVLLKRLDELYSEAEKTVAGMTDNEENFPDPTDRATLESDRNFILRIRDRERKLIMKIREALQRIEEGHFGQCDECGDDIGIERLNARPVTTLCIECKRKQEAMERVRGA